MQYTLRNIPRSLDRALRERARREGKSLNAVTLPALLRALGLAGAAAPQRDLSDIAGTWREDPETAASLADQRRVDPEMWK
jgi:hypothetical protein